MRRVNMISGSTLLALAILTTSLAAGSAWAGPDRPLAVIDSQRIASEYEAARDAQEQYQKYLKELQKDVDLQEKELTSLADEIESQKMLLGEDALATKMQQFEQKKAKYFQFRDGIDKKAEQEYNTRITPILDQIKTIVERIGKEKGYGLIIDAAAVSVLYLDPDYDLTNDVLAALARGDD